MRKKPVRRAEAERPRRSANLSLDRELLGEAKKLGINLSRACERGLAQAVADARAERWFKENETALRSSNDYVERHGLPLRRHRMF